MSLVGLLSALVVAQTTPAKADVGDITEYPIPSTPSSPHAIAAGPDGAMWFTDLSGRQIGRITTSGVITEFGVPSAESLPDIAPGPDGAMWFTEGNDNRIGRISLTEGITHYPTPNSVKAITAGPDEALWYTTGGMIGRMTTAGEVTEYRINALIPEAITAGPDGALWFAEFNENRIGRITTGGVVTEYPLPTPNSFPLAITAGPDGAVWFTESSRIGRITTDGVITEYPIPPFCCPTGITAGADGALWITESGLNKIGRMTTDGVLTEYPLPGALYAGLADIALGPDGSLWFTEEEVETIGRIEDAPRTVVSPSPDSGPPGTEVEVSGQGFGAWEPVSIAFLDSANGPTTLTKTISNRLGRFRAQVIIPTGATLGVQAIGVKGLVSNLATARTFTVT